SRPLAVLGSRAFGSLSVTLDVCRATAVVQAQPLLDFAEDMLPAIVFREDVPGTFGPHQLFVARAQSLQRKLTNSGRHSGIFLGQDYQSRSCHAGKSPPRTLNDFR